MTVSKRTVCAVVCSAVLTSLLLASCSAQALVAGASRDLQPVYDHARETGRFECLDKSKTIPFTAVNDDYCDCADGSDEPGTSACVGLDIHGVLRAQDGSDAGFLCANVGFRSEYIARSRVSDGICDCCDGSDEVNTVFCTNVCATVEKEREATLRAEAAMRAKATTVRAGMRREAEAMRAAMAKELAKLKADVARYEADLTTLENSITPLVEKQQAKRDELKKVYDAWVAANRNTPSTEDGGALCVGWRQTGKCRADGPLEPDLDRDCDDVIPESASGYCECIPNTETEDVGDSDADPLNVHHGFACKHAPLTCAYVCAHEGRAGLRDDAPPSDGSSYVLPELTSREDDIAQARRSLDRTRAKLEESERTLARNLGTEDLLRTLDGQSFTLDHQDYTYELVLFQNTFQHNKGQRGGPSLGKWHSFAESTYSSWAKDAFDLSQMIYKDGARCWNGVVRSTDVHVVCGAENRLALIEEPSMCKYAMVFETPAMCEE